MNAMQPDISKITIGNNIERIKRFIAEAITEPRIKIREWSKITNQTPNLKIGYPGQHLASLITGIPGTATGARGKDIADGTEVKSCSRVDQVDKCKDCESNVMRSQTFCPACGSTNIKRNNDSKWLIAVRSEEELEMYLKEIPRTLLLISDYPNFKEADYTTLRISAFEIWNRSDRASAFRKLLEDYYYNYYLTHIKTQKKAPAPKNFWPYSYQFYFCNPIKTFDCMIYNADTRPKIEIMHFIDPKKDRSQLPSEDMPTALLKKKEKAMLKKLHVNIDSMEYIDEKIRANLQLRNDSKPVTQKKKYHR